MKRPGPADPGLIAEVIERGELAIDVNRIDPAVLVVGRNRDEERSIAARRPAHSHHAERTLLQAGIDPADGAGGKVQNPSSLSFLDVTHLRAGVDRGGVATLGHEIGHEHLRVLRPVGHPDEHVSARGGDLRGRQASLLSKPGRLDHPAQ